MADVAQSFRADQAPLAAPGEADLHVRDMTATFSAELTLSKAQAKLAAVGQWLPIDGDGSRSLGQLVLEDSTGPLRLGFGAWRDLLLGIQFRNGIGELISAGGRVIKNVAGYDLTKFMVGSHGLFGTPVTVTVRTYRRPMGAVIVRQHFQAGVIGALMPTPLRPHWAMIQENHILLGFLGDADHTDFYASKVDDLSPIGKRRRTIEEDIAEREKLWRADGEICFRAAVPPASIGAFVEQANPERWVADGAFGIVLGGVSESVHEAVVAAAGAVGGAIRLWRGGALGNSPITLLHLSTNAGERQIIERLKEAFDPQRLLPSLPWLKP